MKYTEAAVSVPGCGEKLLCVNESFTMLWYNFLGVHINLKNMFFSFSFFIMAFMKNILWCKHTTIPPFVVAVSRTSNNWLC